MSGAGDDVRRLDKRYYCTAEAAASAIPFPIIVKYLNTDSSSVHKV